ncbi:MAG: hypothetical protein ACJ0DH_07335 [bacterium]
MGVVLSPDGGALAKMLPVFKFGLGGTLGSGHQMMSWIAMEDMIHAIMFFIENETLQGIYNLVSPNAVSNVEFTTILGWVLKRPTLFPRSCVSTSCDFWRDGDADHSCKPACHSQKASGSRF